MTDIPGPLLLAMCTIKKGTIWDFKKASLLIWRVLPKIIQEWGFMLNIYNQCVSKQRNQWKTL